MCLDNLLAITKNSEKTWGQKKIVYIHRGTHQQLNGKYWHFIREKKKKKKVKKMLTHALINACNERKRGLVNSKLFLVQASIKL